MTGLPDDQGSFPVIRSSGHLVILLIVALLNISPFLVRHVGADIWFYLVWMRCFSEQLWQGDLYPRWCMDVNDGLGTSLFLMYFPLPFYLAALFQPLIQLGLDYYSLFILLCFLASFTTLITCFSWLRDIVETRYALLASILFIFLPYHLEMVFFRGAYSEIWVIALLPLLFKYTRKIARGEGGIVKLSMVTSLALLTHIPVAAEALLFSGVYILAMTGKSWRPKIDFALALTWGFALGAFYIIPAVYYQPFLANAPLASGLYGWPNNFLTLGFLKISGLERPFLAALLTMLLLAGITITIAIKRTRITDAFIRRETLTWLIISLLALFMLFPFSAPLYTLMGPFAKVLFPWRMQMIVTLGIIFMLAIWMQWLIAPSRRKTWKLDFSLAIMCLWVLSNILVASYSDAGNALNEHIRAAKIVFAPEYRSQWTDTKHWEYEYLLARRRQPIPQAEILSDSGSADVKQWNWRGIDVQVQSTKPVTLRIDHSYFPVWRAQIDNTTATLRPEDKTGLMLLDIPSGEHAVTLTYDISNGNPYLLASQWLSMVALLALMWRIITRKIL